MANRGHRVEERSARAIEMEGILAELDESGRGLTEFARQRGIPASTLQWWRSVRRRRAQSSHEGRRPRAKEPRFVEVGARSDPGAAAARKTSGVFEVVLRQGRTVWVPLDFDAAVLERLIRTLEATC